jgi:acetyl esterase/lipase
VAGFAFDAQVQTELASVLASMGDPQPPAVGDVPQRRLDMQRMCDVATATWTHADNVEVDSYAMTSVDGATVRMRWYHLPTIDPPGSAVLFLHGGGMIVGFEHLGVLYDLVVREYVAGSGVPMLTVDYRVAPEHPHPAPVEDSYAALLWLTEHAAMLGVDPDRIAVMGDSAGGGLAAAVSLLARDRNGPSIAQQLLIYPMLDDRTTTPDPHLQPFLTWSYDDNITGWRALLGDNPRADSISPYAAPARAWDLSGLPATYLCVGDLDIFRDEDLSYARRLTDSGVPTEVHMYPGCPHAFVVFAHGAEVSRRAIDDCIRRLRSL